MYEPIKGRNKPSYGPRYNHDARMRRACEGSLGSNTASKLGEVDCCAPIPTVKVGKSRNAK